MKKMLISMVLLLFCFLSNATLINALIEVESNGRNNAIGDRGNAIGCLQIWPVVVEDVRRISGRNYRMDDRFDRKKSIEMCIIYLKYYGKSYERRTGRKATLEVLARIWNGGPRGYLREDTKKYWKKVKKAYQKQVMFAST